MKQIWNFLLALAIMTGLCACGKADAPTWQEQYDLGVRYLSEGNYEEAIIAFTAAIEIDPKRAPAYVGRGDAYVGSLPEENMTEHTPEFAKAEADYLAAIEIDSSAVEVYVKLSELYLAVGDVDSAIAILEQGYQATGDETLNSRRQGLGVIDSDEVIWTDPVFERLIRDKIGIPDGPVYVRDLDEITNLIIYGDSAVFINDEDESDWWFRGGTTSDGRSMTLSAYYGNNDVEYTTRGAIANVDTLRYFQNLHSVRIFADHISDISVLDQLSDLESAVFWGNEIADLSPLDRLADDHSSDNEEQFVEIGDILTLMMDR